MTGSTPSFFRRCLPGLFRLRTLGIGFFLVAALITLVALVFALWSWRSERAWQAVRQDLEAHGEKVTLQDVIPATVPDSQNFAMIPFFAPLFDYDTRNGSTEFHQKEAWTRVTSQKTLSTTGTSTSKVKSPVEARWRLGHLTDLVAWQDYYLALADYPHPAKPGRPGADVLIALDRDAAEFSALREGLSRPFCRFPIHYDTPNPAGILLPHLAVTKRLTGFVELRCLALLSESKPEEALRDLELAFRLQTGVEKEPVLLSYLVRLVEWQMVQQVLWEGVAQHQWNAATLAALQSKVESMDFMEGCAFAVQGERAFGNAIYNRWVSNRLKLGQDFGEFENETSEKSTSAKWVSAASWLVPSGFIRDNQIVQNQYLSQMLASIRSITVSPGVYQPIDFVQFNRVLGQILEPPALKNRLVRMLAPAVAKTLNKALIAQSSRDLAVLGIALERYRLAKGEYPESLASLSPDWLKQIPKDVYSGQDLHYRRDGKNGVWLYSVGFNKVDDGGEWPTTLRSSEQELGHAGAGSDDVVWRYPQP